jgi:DNA-binding MarR family transcriptional regulator
MPVRLEDHDPDIDLRPGTTRSDIVVYLYRNPELGYSPQDITDALDIPRGTATTTLNRLSEDGYLGKTDDGYYYALSDRDDVRRYISNLGQVHQIFSHHRDADTTPEEPETQIEGSRTAGERDAERAELESTVETVTE